MPENGAERSAPGRHARAARLETWRALLRFLLVRLALLVLLILLAGSAMMLLVSLAPGDAADPTGAGAEAHSVRQERERLGLDRPLADRYWAWLGRAIRLDLGTSFTYSRPVTELVADRMANSATLAFAALLLAGLVALPLGALAGSGRWPWLSASVGACSLVALSLPSLLTALVLSAIAARTGWLPVSAMNSLEADALPVVDRVADAVRHLIVPACALAVPLGAMLERVQAAAVASGRHERHVLAARALGLSFPRVLWRDLWRPTLAPVASLFGLAAGSLLSGSLGVEIVTSWPGLGRLMFEALGTRDVPLAAGCASAAAALLALWSTMADLLVWGLDPRTRAEDAA